MTKKTVQGKMRLPKMSQEALHSVDATPNADYPLRILRTYRKNCNCRWELSGPGFKDAEKAIWEAMNKDQERRAVILDRAIAILERELKKA